MTQTTSEAYKLTLQAKRKRDRQSFGEFRKIDQKLFDADRKKQLEARISEFRENIRVYRMDITEWEHDAAKAADLFTLADQHAAAAEKYALEAREAWELVRGDRLEDGRAPDEVAEAEIRMEKAGKVAAARRAEADRARISLDETDAALAAQRSGLAAAERQLEGLAEHCPLDRIRGHPEFRDQPGERRHMLTCRVCPVDDPGGQLFPDTHMQPRVFHDG